MRILKAVHSALSLRKIADKTKSYFSVRVFHKTLSALLLLIWDAAVAVLSVVTGFCLRYGFIGMPKSYFEFLREYAILSIIVVLICTLLFGCYSNVWRHAGIGDYCRIIAANIVATVIMGIIDSVKKLGLPVEYIILVAIVELLLMLTARASFRFASWAHTQLSLIRRRKKMKRVLIYGAGQAGTELAHLLAAHPEENRRAVCFIDDNDSIWGKKVSGLTVVGGRDKLAEAIKSYNISEVITTVLTAGNDTLKEMLITCHRLHCPLKRFGSIDDVNVHSLKAPITDINLEDLLRRGAVTLNMRAVKSFIEGKTVLVTGGAGSIGSEICRQALEFGARRLVVFDICENGLFDIQNELREKFDGSFDIVLGSIRDRARLEDVFERFSPQIVFHAAAHKHVPMMELNPFEAVKNNVFGTINVAHACIAHGCEKFILISTDKAVNPANIMGATKRIAEMAMQLLNRRGVTDLAAVRFGNVLGSSGSVVPFFKKQIEAGGPVTVTHRDMRRYFMTIHEAVQLVLEAGAMAHGGEIFVLDMGKPVYIYDLACDLIRLSGYEPNNDIKIEFTGLRPGEKLFEEISLADEFVTKTSNNKIYICKPAQYDTALVQGLIDELSDRVESGDGSGVFGCVGRLVPTFADKSRIFCAEPASSSAAAAAAANASVGKLHVL